MLKANLHTHTADDPEDCLSYSFFQAIDEAEKLNINVLALTCHRKLVFKNEYKAYAQQKGILLISGVEAKIEGKHVVILNCDKNIEKIRTFEELKKYKRQHPEIFILAPHPFVWDKRSLKEKLTQHIDIFDAVELSVFSNLLFNFNEKAVLAAERHNKPLVATSDTHMLKNMKRGYCFVDTPEKTPEAIFKTIKENKIKNKIIPMNPLKMTEYMLGRIARQLLQKIKGT